MSTTYERNLHERIAACLGWTVNAVQSFSLATVGEMVRAKDSALYSEIRLVREQWLHVYSPMRDPRRVPMPDMAWLSPQPKDKP